MGIDHDIGAAFEAARAKLRQQMAFAGIRQRDLAARAGIAQSTLFYRIGQDKVDLWAEMAPAWPAVRRILVQLLRDLADAHEREANRRADQAEDEAMRPLEQARGLMRKGWA